MSILLSSLVVCGVRSLPGDDGERSLFSCQKYNHCQPLAFKLFTSSLSSAIP
ncbi:hypothetical protein [Nostoc sp.]|uniref:hypothetical protein n=1 Tax=Nostoc sp. TaxID=1180 RepID=UPI002FF482CA